MCKYILERDVQHMVECIIHKIREKDSDQMKDFFFSYIILYRFC